MAEQYTQLLEWRRSEGASRGLAKLPHDFYPSIQAYLSDVRRAYESELRENPSGRKGELARQTYQRASQVARDIVEARMTKLLSAAFQTTVGGARETPNALGEERRLFESLVGLLQGHRATVAPYLEPPSTAGSSPSVAPITMTPKKAEDSPRRAPDGRASPEAAPMSFVRVLKDAGPIEVGGETIDLRKEDVLSLPPEKARLLIDSKVAENISLNEPRTVT